MIAAENDPEIFRLLLATAEAWLKERGCVYALGPLNLSTNEQVGLLVDGFDTPPMVMMDHDPAYAGNASRSRATARPRTSTPGSTTSPSTCPTWSAAGWTGRAARAWCCATSTSSAMTRTSAT